MGEDRQRREDAWFIGRFDEITDALAPLCSDPKVNDGYRLLFAFRSQLARASGERIVSAIGVSTRERDCPQPFGLYRHEDVTGVSGTGAVAYGVRFADGTVVIRWQGENPSTVVWDSLEAAMRVHGHDGRTRAVWLMAPFSEMAKAEEEAAAAVRDSLAREFERRAENCGPLDQGGKVMKASFLAAAARARGGTEPGP